MKSRLPLRSMASESITPRRAGRSYTNWLPTLQARYDLDRATTVRGLLVQAGYRRPEALSIFWGTRTALAGGVAVAATAVGLASGNGVAATLFAAAWGGTLGWLAPTVYLRTRVRARQAEINRTLPDALDLIVVCMEAGLGLNQAIARMADEIRHFSTATSDLFSSGFSVANSSTWSGTSVMTTSA